MMKRIAAAGVAALAIVALSGCASGPLYQPGPGVTVPGPQVSPDAETPQPTDPATQPVPPPPASPVQQSGQVGSEITEERAQEISLAHAQVPAGTTNVYCVYDREFDWPRSNPEWDCEFIVGDLEYSYEIDAVTGQILNFERESVWD